MNEHAFPILIEMSRPTRRRWVATPANLPSGEGFTVISTRPDDNKLARILNASEAGFFPDDDVIFGD